MANNRVPTSHFLRYIVEKILSHIVDPDVSNPLPFHGQHNRRNLRRTDLLTMPRATGHREIRSQVGGL